MAFPHKHQNDDSTTDIDTSMPIRYLSLDYVHSATSPGVSAGASSNVRSKKVKARKINHLDEDSDQNRKPSIIHVYSRRVKRPRHGVQSSDQNQKPPLPQKPSIVHMYSRRDKRPRHGVHNSSFFDAVSARAQPKAANIEEVDKEEFERLLEKRKFGSRELVKLGVDSNSSVKEWVGYLTDQKLPRRMLRLQKGTSIGECESDSAEDEMHADSGEGCLDDIMIPRTLDCPETSLLVMGGLLIIRLGRIVRDSKYFQEKRYVWPEGYTSIREFTSITDPSVCTLYKMEVLRDSESKIRPHVSLDTGEKFKGPTPSACWNKIYERIRKMQNCALEDSNANADAEDGLERFYKSGSEMFGFSTPEVAKLIQALSKSSHSSKVPKCKSASRRYQDVPVGYRPVRVDWKDLDKCTVCHMDEEYENNLFLRCDKCRIMLGDRLHLLSVDDDEEGQCIRFLSFCKKHKQPSNDFSAAGDHIGREVCPCSEYTPPSNPSGCARTGKSGIHGFGIIAKCPRRAGDMVIEYTGEHVRPPTADRRARFNYNSLVPNLKGTTIIAIVLRVGVILAVDARISRENGQIIDSDQFHKFCRLSRSTGVTMAGHVLKAKKVWKDMMSDARRREQRGPVIVRELAVAARQSFQRHGVHQYYATTGVIVAGFDSWGPAAYVVDDYSFSSIRRVFTAWAIGSGSSYALHELQRFGIYPTGSSEPLDMPVDTAVSHALGALYCSGFSDISTGGDLLVYFLSSSGCELRHSTCMMDLYLNLHRTFVHPIYSHDYFLICWGQFHLLDIYLGLSSIGIRAIFVSCVGAIRDGIFLYRFVVSHHDFDRLDHIIGSLVSRVAVPVANASTVMFLARGFSGFFGISAMDFLRDMRTHPGVDWWRRLWDISCRIRGFI